MIMIIIVSVTPEIFPYRFFVFEATLQQHLYRKVTASVKRKMREGEISFKMFLKTHKKR